ncbi:MAG: hypothetical protein MUE60_14860 [Candidatus Eisenbacteria bacterium]|jgi:hypothetical protein|nr:hypothetical protein [Candidatus Eisenbacteria bacterium]
MIVLALVLSLVASPAGSDVTTMLARADSTYHQALASEGMDRTILAQRAAAVLEQVAASEGRWNGHVLYNLGTAYHLGGDLGRAVLNYRKAQRLLRGFPDLESNLEVALAQRRDKIEPGQREEIVRALFFWHHLLSPTARRWIFAGGFLLLWLMLTLNVFRRNGVATALAVLAAVIAVVFGLSVGSDFMASARKNHGVIVTREVGAKTGPGASYAAAYEGGLHAGTELRTLDQEEGWCRVRLIDGSECWLPEDSFERY